MDAVGSTQMLVTTYRNIKHHIAKECAVEEQEDRTISEPDM
jgi:hypothetical protein